VALEGLRHLAAETLPELNISVSDILG